VSRLTKLEHSRQYIHCHKKAACKGPWCPIHKRSAHHMRSWPQNWRDDTRIMERICVHGVGHPDPDDPSSVDEGGVHGCDGCCRPPDKPINSSKPSK